MDAIASLLRLADVYCVATGLAEATVSTRCLADGKRLAAIRAGADIGARRLSRAMTWFASNWPADASWPDGVPFPAPERGDAA